jgi:hypothetical protein
MRFAWTCVAGLWTFVWALYGIFSKKPRPQLMATRQCAHRGAIGSRSGRIVRHSEVIHKRALGKINAGSSEPTSGPEQIPVRLSSFRTIALPLKIRRVRSERPVECRIVVGCVVKNKFRLIS